MLIVSCISITISLSIIADPNCCVYSEDADYAFFDQLFYTPMHYSYLYQNEAIRIVNRASSLAAQFSAAGNRFETERNLRIAEDFRGRSVPAFSDYRHSEALIGYDYSSLLVLLLSLFGLCTVFVTERETGMDMLLRTTRRGGMITVAAKFTASALFVLTLCVLFFTEDFVILFALAGRSEFLGSPIYGVPWLEITPLRMAAGMYFLWSAAIRTLGIFGICCLILLVSSLTRRTLTSFAAGLCVTGICILLQMHSLSTAALKWFNPMELVFIRDNILEDQFVNLFGHAVHLYAFVITGNLLTTAAVCLFVCCRSYGRVRGRRGRNDSV